MVKLASCATNNNSAGNHLRAQSIDLGHAKFQRISTHQHADIIVDFVRASLNGLFFHSWLNLSPSRIAEICVFFIHHIETCRVITEMGSRLEKGGGRSKKVEETARRLEG